MTSQIQLARILIQISDAIIDVVKAAGPQGAPAGVLYAALLPHGCQLGQFEAIMSALVATGKINEKGGSYFAP